MNHNLICFLVTLFIIMIKAPNHKINNEPFDEEHHLVAPMQIIKHDLKNQIQLKNICCLHEIIKSSFYDINLNNNNDTKQKKSIESFFNLDQNFKSLICNYDITFQFILDHTLNSQINMQIINLIDDILKFHTKSKAQNDILENTKLNKENFIIVHAQAIAMNTSKIQEIKNMYNFQNKMIQNIIKIQNLSQKNGDFSNIMLNCYSLYDYMKIVLDDMISDEQKTNQDTKFIAKNFKQIITIYKKHKNDFEKFGLMLKNIHKTNENSVTIETYNFFCNPFPIYALDNEMHQLNKKNSKFQQIKNFIKK